MSNKLNSLCFLLRVKMNEDAFEVPERTEYRYLVQEEDEEDVQYVRHRHYISPLLVLSRRCIFFICLCVLALLSLATYLGYVAQTLPPGLAQVATDCGEFRGRHVSLDTDSKFLYLQSIENVEFSS